MPEDINIKLNNNGNFISYITYANMYQGNRLDSINDV